MRTIAMTLCSGCGRFFSSDSEFDAHRTGKFNQTPSARRCMTPGEMAAAGFISRRMIVRNKGEQDVWTRKASLERFQKAHSALTVPPKVPSDAVLR